jgi:hypothetical protein
MEVISFRNVGWGNVKAWKLIGKHSSPFQLARGIVLGNSRLPLQHVNRVNKSRFALKELRLILVTIIRRYELSLVEGQSHELRVHTVPWFKQGYYNVGVKMRSWCLVRDLDGNKYEEIYVYTKQEYHTVSPKAQCQEVDVNGRSIRQVLQWDTLLSRSVSLLTTRYRYATCSTTQSFPTAKTLHSSKTMHISKHQKGTNR